MVIEEEVLPEEQQKFVEELRRQGFVCNTQAEIDNFQKTAKDSQDYYKKLGDLKNQVVTFKTITEIKEQGNAIKESWMITWFGGKNL